MCCLLQPLHAVLCNVILVLIASSLGALIPVLHGRDTYVCMATGGGKSLCMYLAPLAASSSATAVVISPLIGLMDEQVVQTKFRIRVTCFCCVTVMLLRRNGCHKLELQLCELVMLMIISQLYMGIIGLVSLPIHSCILWS